MPHKDPVKRKAYLLQYAKDHAEKAKARAKQWYRDNRARALRAMKEYREANRELVKQKSRDWYLRNRSKVIAKSAAWAEKNPDRVRQASKKHYHAHLEQQRERNRKYRDTPDGKAKALQRVRKFYGSETRKRWLAKYKETDAYKTHAKKQKAHRRSVSIVQTLTNEEWQDILSCFEHRCAYCGHSGKLEQDHYVPIAKGGHHTKENVVPACRSCNAKKSSRHPHRLF